MTQVATYISVQNSLIDFVGEGGISNQTDSVPHFHTEVAKDVLHCSWVFNVD